MVKKFKSLEAFRKNAAYVHMHNIPHKSLKEVEIAGHIHKIKHPHNYGLCRHCGQMHI